MVAGADQQVIAARVAMIPLGRIGEPWDVAATAAFLATSEAEWITGEELAVSGGRYA